MRNFKFTLAYDGTDFHGWQVQPGRPTIQAALADALRRITGETVLPQGSGRTDAGVHALAQVASCELASSIPAANLVMALNDILPPAIRVMQVEEAPPEFHARKSARAKTYRYRIYRGDICPPLLARYVYHHPYPLDEEAMAAAAAPVIGEHDFTSFAAVDAEKREELCGTGSILAARVRDPCHTRTNDPTFGRFLFRNGSAPVKSSSIPSAAAVSCTTWCATWWGRFCWWGREACKRANWRAFCRRAIARRIRARRRRPAGCI